MKIYENKGENRQLFSNKTITGFFLLNIIACVIFLIVLIGFNNLDQFLMEPLLTPQEYLDSHPWILINLGTLSFIWSEPSSTVLVYGLGIMTILFGVILVRLSSSLEKSNRNRDFVKVWGISLIIWGIGTMLAGTSYQAFFYELKCRDQEFCLWTTWWEIGYLTLTVISVNGMLLAFAYLRLKEKLRNIITLYATINMLGYFIVLIFGMILVNQFMLSFEMMVIFQMPSFIIAMIHNIIEYIKNKDKFELQMIGIWILLAIVMGLYFGYYYSGIPESLWDNGIWFNANDILHVGLIGWMIYIYVIMKNSLKSK